VPTVRRLGGVNKAAGAEQKNSRCQGARADPAGAANSLHTVVAPNKKPTSGGVREG
jgi:hypothetical protein